MTDIQGIRDSRVDTHSLALALGREEQLYLVNLESARLAGDMLVHDTGGDVYDVTRTYSYIREITRSQLSAGTDGLGSATGAVMFGVREFAYQDKRAWLLTWHHTPGQHAREEHLQLDGVQVPAAEGFTVSPGIGSPGCACWIELEEVT